MTNTTQHVHRAASLRAFKTSGRRRSWLLQPRILQIVADSTAILAAHFIYQMLRERWLVPGYLRFPLEQELVAGVFTVLYFVLIFWFGGLYRDYYVRSPFEEVWRVLRQACIGSGLFFLAIVLSSAEYYRENPRLVFLVFWLLMSASVIFGRLLVRRVQQRFRERGVVTIPAVLLGTSNKCKVLAQELKRQPALGYVIQGVLLDDDRAWTDPSVPYIGSSSILGEVLEQYRPKELLLAMDHPDHDRLLAISSDAAEIGVSVKIVPDLYEIFSGQARTMQMYGTQLIDVSPQLMEPWEEVAKRVMDVVVSITFLTIGIPLWIVTAIAIKLTDRGPVFYSQQRVGKNGSIFKMYKFRSMYVDPDRKPSWTSVNDPRVTPIGRFIRKTHVDEFPQLWNVIRGEMSLVGPRPEMPFYVEKFSAVLPVYRRRLKVRPGVTGWWQVKYKAYEESIDEVEDRLRYDFFYIENMSFRLDLEILFRTVFVMIKGHGQA